MGGLGTQVKVGKIFFFCRAKYSWGKKSDMNWHDHSGRKMVWNAGSGRKEGRNGD